MLSRISVMSFPLKRTTIAMSGSSANPSVTRNA